MCSTDALSLAGKMVSAYGSFQSGRDQASALTQQAKGVLEQGYQNELDYREQAHAKLASQLAALSTRGIALDSGTPLALLQASARNQEIDALRIRADAQNKSASLRASASAMKRAALITAGAQVLSGLGDSQQSGGLAQLGSMFSSGAGSAGASSGAAAAAAAA